jgi:hypothetical protein
MDEAGIGVRSDDEVILKLPIGAVIDEIDAGVGLCDTGSGIGGDRSVDLRLVACEVVDIARRGRSVDMVALLAVPLSVIRTAAVVVVMESPRSGRLCSAGALRPRARRRNAELQQHGVMAAAREELHGGVGLFVVGLEAEGAIAVGGVHLRLRGRGRLDD